MSQHLRVRFAPSPTGMLHIGAARTALYCWLFACQQNGDFILRIEDTDKAREVERAVDNIKESLEWLGLKWQDTFKQSERLDIYHQYAKQLLDKGLAYADPYSAEELEELRQKTQDDKEPFLFRNFRPDDPPKWDGSQPLRFKVPSPKRYEWDDIARGRLSAGPEALDDIILIKSDGYPTYNFAHIIDDHLTHISHVLRGEEFISSIPKYLSIYEAFGWQPPQFVTVPPILGKSGNKKLSKREGAEAVLDYRQQGYLPEAINNFLAGLGWNDGTQQEIYTTEELIKKFSLERIQRSGAKFDRQRLDWINTQHLKRLSTSELLKRSEDFWPDGAKHISQEQRTRILEIDRERIKTLKDISKLPDYLFQPPSISPQEAAALDTEFADKTEGASLKDWLTEAGKLIHQLGDSYPTKLEKELRQTINEHSGDTGTLFSMLRVALTNADSTPPIWDLVYMLGENESAQRLDRLMKLF